MVLARLREEREVLYKRIGVKDMDIEFLKKKLEKTEPALRVAMVDRQSETPVEKSTMYATFHRKSRSCFIA